MAHKHFGVNALDDAIRAGDEAAALRLIAARQFIHGRDRKRRTALHWAAVRGQLVIVEALIAAGADVNDQMVWAEGGTTPLVDGIEHEGVVRALLAPGADVNAVSYLGSALHCVVLVTGWEQALRIATILIDAGADPHARGEFFDGLTALEVLEKEYPGFTATLIERAVLRGFW